MTAAPNKVLQLAVNLLRDLSAAELGRKASNLTRSFL